MSNVVKLEPVEIGESFRFDPDQVLEDAKGQDFSCLAVLGQMAKSGSPEMQMPARYWS